MAAGDRSKKIRVKVQTTLGDPRGVGIAFEGNVYDSLNRIQQIILEDASAAQTKETVYVLANTELYNLPDGLIAISAILPGSTTPLEKKSIQEVADIKRQGTALANTTSDPIYYYIWAGQIGFMNASGGAPTAAATVYLYGWKTLKDDLSVDASDAIDPIVNRRWDTCLYYGTLMDLTSEAKWIAHFERELVRCRTFENASRQISYTIPVNDDG